MTTIYDKYNHKYNHKYKSKKYTRSKKYTKSKKYTRSIQPLKLAHQKHLDHKVINNSTNNPSNDIITNLNSRYLDNLLHYSDIFHHNRKHDKKILFIKKTEFDIFYSCKCKYPLLVKESITSLTGKTELNHPIIDRRKLIDPFREDPIIPEQYRHTLDDFKQFITFGISMGHNAPAGQHKTNMTIFSETFMLSNITPQEMVLNSGLWVLIENWCKDLNTNYKLYNITVFTGSIPDTKNTIYNGISMNIPQKMFKIVCCNHIDNPNIIYMDIICVSNKPFYINTKATKFSLEPYVIDKKSWKWFENYSNIDIKTLLKFYSFNSNAIILPLTTIMPMICYISYKLNILMIKSNWFGYLIYAQTVTELNKKWDAFKLFIHKYDKDISFHQEYYESVLARLTLQEAKLYKT